MAFYSIQNRLKSLNSTFKYFQKGFYPRPFKHGPCLQRFYSAENPDYKKYVDVTPPTAQELELVKKLRTNLKDFEFKGRYDTDLWLTQWLRARQLKQIEWATSILRQCLIWRQENNMDNILSWQPPPDLLDLCPVSFSGYDKETCPVAVMHLGRWQLRKIVSLGLRDDYVKFRCQVIEKLVDKMTGKIDSETGQPITKCVLLVDSQGLTFSSFTTLGVIDMLREGTKVLEAHYAETLKRLIVIKASPVFTAMYTVVKPLASHRSRAKVQVYGEDPEKWRPVLFDLFPKETIPIYLGGTFKSRVDTEGDDNSLTVKTGDNSPDDGQPQADSNEIVVTLEGWTRLPLEIQVEKPGSTLSWSFTTEGGGIDFSVIYGLDKIIKFEKQLVDKLEGSLECKDAGTYLVVFDNSKGPNVDVVLKYSFVIS